MENPTEAQQVNDLTRQSCCEMLMVIKHQIYLITQLFIIVIKFNFQLFANGSFCFSLFTALENAKFINCFMSVDFSRIEDD